MEQLRHRLTHVSPKGQRYGANQNPLKRSDLEEFVNCYFGGTSFRTSGDLQKQVPPQGNRHPFDSAQGRLYRKEGERFKSFTYEELAKRDP